MDAPGLDAGQLLEIGKDGPKGMAIVGIAVERLGVEVELAALGRGDRGGHGDFASELVGCPGLAFADAFHLRGMQGIDLAAALALILVTDLAGQDQQGAEESLKLAIAIDLAVDGDANGAPHPDSSSYARMFSGKYSHRTIKGGIGHNLPQEAPQAFAQAIVDVAES
jgi:pimeloyl-ACP methyl ester carboxylesterase